MLLPYEKIRARPKASIKYFIVLTKPATRPPTNRLALCWNFPYTPNLRLKFMLGVYDGIDGIVSNLNFETRCLKSAASLIQWWVQTVLFFFLDFFWRSGMLEYWIRSCVRGHWFGCSLLPGTPLNSSWKLASSVFCDQWPYWFRRDNRGSPGPRPDPCPSSTYPLLRKPAFLQW